MGVHFRWEVIRDYWPLILQGTLVTIEVTVIAVLAGTLLGLILGLMRLGRGWWWRWPALAYITFFRGTPLFVQILLLHFAVIPQFNGGRALDAQISGTIALLLNSAAYVAEIFRAGIQSIDRGQMEAARSLGLRAGQAMRYVILPQAFRRMLPPLGNEAIALLKDSSLLAVIAGGEIATQMNLMFGRILSPWEPFMTLAFVYLVLTLVLQQVVAYLERRYGQG